MAIKVFITGSVNGNISHLVSRQKTLDEKQKAKDGKGIGICVVVGDLFGDPADSTEGLLKDIAFPIPTYFTRASRELPDTIRKNLEDFKAGSFAPNLTYIRSGESVTTSDGVRIAAFKASDSKEAKLEALDRLRSAWNAKKPLDILLAPDLSPQELTDPSNITPGPGPYTDTFRLLRETMPRYVLSGSISTFTKHAFYSTTHGPYGPETNITLYRITWLYAVASINNTEGAKHETLFLLDPTAPDTEAMPSGTPAAPWLLPSKPEKKYYHPPSPAVHHGKKRKFQGADPFQQKLGCYLCLDNKAAEPHLVFDLAAHSYVTVAKGPLTLSTKLPSFDRSPDPSPHSTSIPTHFIIVPYSHEGTFPAMKEPNATRAEMMNYRRALARMVAPFSTITLELTRFTTPHVLWQVIALPNTSTSPTPVTKIHETLCKSAQDLGFNPATTALSEGDEGFTAWISPPPVNFLEHAEEMKEKLVSVRLGPDDAFPAQFGRKALAECLGIPERERWQLCVEGNVEEERGRDVAMAAFEPFRLEGS
ncbi:MAG: hypothetical protein Q9159_003204 [Coniocarpon cinnabarinum]